MSEQELDLQEVEPDRWGARASLLTMAGAWNVEAIVRARGMDDIRHTFVVDTAESPANNQPGAPPVWALLVVCALLLAALGQLPDTQRTRAGLYAASGLLLAGALLAPLGARLAPAARPENLSAAAPADAAAGRTVYEQSCISCHGTTGRGDGSAGWALDPRPADFTQPHFEEHSDAELASTISDGVPGTGMPAFGSQLSDQQIRDVITYLRQFGLEP